MIVVLLLYASGYGSLAAGIFCVILASCFYMEMCIMIDEGTRIACSALGVGQYLFSIWWESFATDGWVMHLTVECCQWSIDRDGF
jgi:hypothetical protein